MIRDIEELKRIMRCNASKSRRGSIDPPDVFLTMEDALDTMNCKVSDIQALSTEEITDLIDDQDPSDEDTK